MFLRMEYYLLITLAILNEKASKEISNARLLILRSLLNKRQFLGASTD